MARGQRVALTARPSTGNSPSGPGMAIGMACVM